MIEMLTGKTVGYLCAMNNVSIKTNVVRKSQFCALHPSHQRKKKVHFFIVLFNGFFF